MDDNEIIFIHTDIGMSDVDLFMNSSPPETLIFQFFTDREILAHLLARSKIFKSVSEAKKNGWDKPIPIGFTHLVVTKKKFKIFILNKF